MGDIISGGSAVGTFINENGGDPKYYFIFSFSAKVENKKLLYLFGLTLKRGAVAEIQRLIKSGKIEAVACARAGKKKNSLFVEKKNRHTKIFDWRVVIEKYPELFVGHKLTKIDLPQQLSFKF